MQIADQYNILLLGSGGREHAMAWKIRESESCGHLFMAPGNPGMELLGTCLNVDLNDFKAIHQIILQNHIKLIICGPEDPLVNGLRDYLESSGALKQAAFIGPGKAGAQLEGSKSFAKQFMQRHQIPTAAYAEFSSAQLPEALEYVKDLPLPIVLKADGLAAGKGVIIAQNHAEAAEELKAMLSGKFGAAGDTVVIEAFLKGLEFSVFVLTDGKNYHLLPVAKDYKRIGEGDTGLNTGGMGSVSPVPFADAEMMQKVTRQIIEPTLRGLQKENIPYTGFIFFGLIEVEGDPFVIEYNCRLGDPETESVMPRIQGDFLKAMNDIANGNFSAGQLREHLEHCASVILVSGGYPEAYEKGKPIKMLPLRKPCHFFHMGTRMNERQLETNGGRVISITCTAADYRDALEDAYNIAAGVDFEGKYYRKDIGFDLA
jgi:phosphoribosylamine---glycine ligase